MRVTKLNIETLANKLEYVAEAVENSGKYYYRVGDITIEITKRQHDNVIINPRLYYFSTALKLHRLIEKVYFSQTNMSLSKFETDRQLRSLIEFGTVHARGANIDWWTSALDTIAAHAAACTERYDEFIWSLQRYVADVAETPFSLLLRRPLTDPQKWLIMVTVDEFLDQEIIPHDTFEHWHKIWRYAVNMYGCAFLYLQANPGVLNPVAIQEAWYGILSASA